MLTEEGLEENPTGLLRQFGIQTREFTDDLIATARKAMMAVEVLGYPLTPSG